MEHDYDDGASDGSGLTAVKLSLVGGIVGTLAGLKRRGVGGAVVGGLLGGATGYAAGAALDGPDTVEEWEDPLADVREDPVTVDVGTEDDDGGFDFDAGDEEKADEEGDEDVEAEGDETDDEADEDAEAEAESDDEETVEE